MAEFDSDSGSTHEMNRKGDTIDPDGKEIREIKPQKQAKIKKTDGKLSKESKKQLENFRDQGLEKRLYRGDQKVHHDLYKLEVAEFQKDVSGGLGQADWRGVEHCHWFHTVDSNGKAQEVSSSIAGHFHVMKIVDNPDKEGPPMIVCDSGPMRWGRRKNKKTRRWERVAISTQDTDIDDHRHEATYIRSQEIGLRAPNIEAAKVQTVEAQQTAPVAGAMGAGGRG